MGSAVSGDRLPHVSHTETANCALRSGWNPEGKGGGKGREEVDEERQAQKERPFIEHLPPHHKTFLRMSPPLLSPQEGAIIIPSFINNELEEFGQLRPKSTAKPVLFATPVPPSPGCIVKSPDTRATAFAN